MNQQSVWLFLATVGCWGITPWQFQLPACVITLAFFMYLAVDGLNEGTPASTLRTRIETLLSDPSFAADEKRSRETEYREMQDSTLSSVNFKQTWLYWLSFAYFLASTVSFVLKPFQTWLSR